MSFFRNAAAEIILKRGRNNRGNNRGGRGGLGQVINNSNQSERCPKCLLYFYGNDAHRRVQEHLRFCQGDNEEQKIIENAFEEFDQGEFFFEQNHENFHQNDHYNIFYNEAFNQSDRYNVYNNENYVQNNFFNEDFIENEIYNIQNVYPALGPAPIPVPVPMPMPMPEPEPNLNVIPPPILFNRHQHFPVHFQGPNPMRSISEVREKFKKIRINWADSHVNVNISREDLFFDTITKFPQDSKSLRSELKVNFIGENSQDAGGLLKEWLNLAITEFFSQNHGIFKQTNTNDKRYSIVNNAHDDSLYFVVGLIIGKALFDNIQINCPLSFFVYKHILSLPVDKEDIKYVDKEIYNALNFISFNMIDGIFFETFSVTDEKGKVYEFTPGGKDISLSEENKEIYVELRTEYETYTSVKNSVESLKKGIFSVFPEDFLRNVSVEELDFMLCGVPEINVREWKEFSLYKGEFSANHKVVKWFWDALFEFSQEELRNFLTFATGSGRIPIEGFKSLTTNRGDPALFTLEPAPYYAKALPRAHTCFNRLDLPLYPNFKELKSALSQVQENFKLGFGLD